MKDQSLLNILAPTMTFDQGGEGDQVWFYSSAYPIIAIKWIGSALFAHVLENLGSLFDIATPHTAINNRVERYDVWFDFLLPLWRDHDVVDLKGFIKIESPTVGLYHCSVDHSIWSNLSFCHNLMENRLSSLNLAIPYASIDKASKSNVIIDFSLADLALVVSENLKSFFKHSHLPVSLDENSDLNRHIVRALIVFCQIKSVVVTLNL